MLFVINNISILTGVIRVDELLEKRAAIDEMIVSEEAALAAAQSAGNKDREIIIRIRQGIFKLSSQCFDVHTRKIESPFLLREKLIEWWKTRLTEAEDKAAQWKSWGRYDQAEKCEAQAGAYREILSIFGEVSE